MRYSVFMKQSCCYAWFVCHYKWLNQHCIGLLSLAPQWWIIWLVISSMNRETIHGIATSLHNFRTSIQFYLLSAYSVYCYSAASLLCPYINAVEWCCGLFCFIILQNCVAEVDWEPKTIDKQYKLEYWHVGRAGKVRIWFKNHCDFLSI